MHVLFCFLSDDDDDCSKENGLRGLCGQQRDLDNIDVCITDLDPCGGVKGATGTLCVVMTAVGVDYHANVNCNIFHKYIGNSIIREWHEKFSREKIRKKKKNNCLRSCLG